MVQHSYNILQLISYQILEQKCSLIPLVTEYRKNEVLHQLMCQVLWNIYTYYFLYHSIYKNARCCVMEWAIGPVSTVELWTSTYISILQQHKYKSLTLFIDSVKIFRVGERLQFSSLVFIKTPLKKFSLSLKIISMWEKSSKRKSYLKFKTRTHSN